jgi:SAM-dependent methyltransferase
VGKKWWRSPLKAPQPAAHGEIRETLARLNGKTAIQIETADDHFPPVGANDLDGTGTHQVREEILAEGHHRQYGRPWAGGKCVFEYLLDAGLRPDHRLLDFGCGSLRVGIWVIPYLDSERYFGIESHLMSLEAATTYEIPFHGLEPKRPRLLWNDRYELSHFDTTFDFILDYSSSIFVREPREPVFAAFGRALAPGGRLVTGPALSAPVAQIERCGLVLARGGVVRECSLLGGHEDRFGSSEEWWEFVRA